MALFSFIAGVLAGVAASYIAAPLWRGASTLAHGRRRYLLAGGFIASFALIAGLFYLALGSRHSLERPASSATASTSTSPSGGATAANGPAKSMEAEVAGLEARLGRDGGTPADWSLLAQAYDFMGRPEDAKRARAKAGGGAAGPTAAAASTPAARPTAAAGPAIWQMGASALTAAASAADTRASAGGSAQERAPATIAPSAAELERRVAANPRDADSWLALADMRRSQRDYAGARTAYVKLVELHAMSAQSWADYADVLGSLAGGSLAGEAGRAIDNALALDASNPKALWLKASQANEQHRYAEALVWWKKLRAVLPTDSPDARMVDANIAEANSLAGTSSAAAGATTPAATTSTAASAAAGAEVSGTVSLDRRFSDRVQSDATLFIYAKAADSPGPPLAVLRTTVGAWPVTFHLDDSMAMIPSRRLSQFDRVVIEARISRSGQATPAAGDLYVTSPVLRPAAGTRLALVINHEIG